jgi:hypothetical protein
MADDPARADAICAGLSNPEHHMRQTLMQIYLRSFYTTLLNSSTLLMRLFLVHSTERSFDL